jgi:hypothetical protein
MADKKWMFRVIQIISEWRDPEVVSNSLRIVNRVLGEDVTYDRLVQTYPSLGNTLLLAISQQKENEVGLFEATEALKHFVRDPKYHKSIKVNELQSLYLSRVK